MDFKWTEQKTKMHETDSWAKLHTNLVLLIWEFNKNLEYGTKKLAYPPDRFVVDKKSVLIKEK